MMAPSPTTPRSTIRVPEHLRKARLRLRGCEQIVATALIVRNVVGRRVLGVNRTPSPPGNSVALILNHRGAGVMVLIRILVLNLNRILVLKRIAQAVEDCRQYRNQW